MRDLVATVTATTLLRPDLYLLELHAPSLAQAVRPGQFYMVRCCHPQVTDPLLRRPFCIHSIEPVQGLCTLLVQIRGRGSAWLAQQQVGAQIALLGPLGHGWELRSTTRNLLLVCEEEYIAGLTLLAQVALKQEVGVTLLNHSPLATSAYSPALLSPEIEYQVLTGPLVEEITPYLSWADAICCSVSAPTALSLYNSHERLRHKQFAQGMLWRPLPCGTGICLLCTVETRSSHKILCHDGPVFELREII